MKVFYTIHFDAPTCEKFTEFHVDTHRTWWCCKQLKEHDKHFQLWNVKWAKFHFKDVSTDGNIAFFPISYCPYCGEKIEYEEFTKGKLGFGDEIRNNPHWALVLRWCRTLYEHLKFSLNYCEL